jgi:16S rRNA (uracil1498-N3)-methyltransferase
LKDAARNAQKSIVLIGPEGDFSDPELALAKQHSYKKVSLGLSRLRTETAGVAACHILNLVNS